MAPPLGELPKAEGVSLLPWHRPKFSQRQCSSVLIPKLYVFVGRGHDPADQVAHFALARFNESAFISLRFGGVMTPPYERQVLGLTA